MLGNIGSRVLRACGDETDDKMIEHDLIIGKDAKGQFLLFGGTEHAILHARSGAGKSVGFSIPNAFCWPGSLVCLDIKRELFRFTAGWREAHGSSVFLFDPAAEDGRSHRWNPFWQVRRDHPVSVSRLSRDLRVSRMTVMRARDEVAA
jgi:type IV secretory pathway TraG/TraD family ATPase VirD4